MDISDLLLTGPLASHPRGRLAEKATEDKTGPRLQRHLSRQREDVPSDSGRDEGVPQYRTRQEIVLGCRILAERDLIRELVRVAMGHLDEPRQLVSQDKTFGFGNLHLRIGNDAS
jgi:hypothetical protein